MEKSKRIQGEKSSSCTSYRIVCIRLGMFTIFSSGRIKVEEKGPVNGKMSEIDDFRELRVRD